MNKIMGIVAAAMLVGIVGGAGVYVSRAGREMPAHGAIVLDLSDSRKKECGSASAMGRELVNSRQMGKGSKLYLFGTGGADTADEPQLLGSFDVHRSNRVIEGKEKADRAEAQVYEGLSSRCEEAPRRNRSPIFLTIKRAAEHLRARGCDSKTRCGMYVQTDGDELSEATVKNALAGGRQGSGEAERLPPPIDNSGIQIRLCGFAEVSRLPKKGGSPRSAGKNDLQREVWQRLFTEPGSVVIEPHCPRP